MPIGKAGRVDEQRPSVLSRRRELALDTKCARAEAALSRVGVAEPPATGDSSMDGRPAFNAWKSAELRQMDSKSNRLPGDEGRVLHEELGLLCPTRHV